MDEMVSQPVPLGYLLADDMIFTSRITGIARDLGFAIKPARSMEIVKKLTNVQTPRCVIVDLANAGLDIDELVRHLRECGRPYIVAYGSHVDTETLRRARAAGCNVVLPRSKFVEDLPRALPAWMGERGS